MALTDAYDGLIADAANTYQVPFAWIKAVIGAESNFDPYAYRPEPAISDASRGLMQLLESTARGLGFTGEVEGLFDPKTNIDLGAKYLRELIDRFGMNFEEIYSAYNSGNPMKYLSSIEVKQHVVNAVAWLNKIMGNGVPGATNIIVYGGLGLLVWKLLQ